jgi:hypothetical protein
MTDRGDDRDDPQRFADENPLGKRRPEARGVAPAMARPEPRRFPTPLPVPPRGDDPPLPERVQPAATRRLTVMRPGDMPVPQPAALPAEWLPPKASEVQAAARRSVDPEPPSAGPVLEGAESAARPSATPSLVARARTVLRDRLLPTLRTPPGIAAVVAGALALLVIVVTVGGADEGDTSVYASEQFSAEEQARLGAAWRGVGVGSWGGVLEDGVVNRHVNAVGSAVVAAFGDRASGRSLSFLVVRDTNAVHAFGLPGDTIVLSAGLLWWLKSDAELAAVLAHMVAHQLLGHPQRALDAVATPEVAQEVRTALGAPAGSQNAVLSSAAEAAATAINGYDVEVAADNLADEALEQAGFDRSALFRVVVERFVSAGGRVAWLVQHPAPPGRQAALQALPAGGRVDDAPYQQEVTARIDRRRHAVPTPASAAATPTAAPTTPALPTTTPARQKTKATKPGPGPR